MRKSGSGSGRDAERARARAGRRGGRASASGARARVHVAGSMSPPGATNARALRFALERTVPLSRMQT
ncbi:unnamed protein product [Lota lota]